MSDTAPRWLMAAEALVGTREIPGAQHSKVILGFWERLKLKVVDDETPWCAAFVGAVLEQSGVRSTRSGAARSYLKWGTKLQGPAVGAIVVFWRGSPTSWSGHVGFVVGRSPNGNIFVLGGNQGDVVSIREFPRERVLGYRWPSTFALPYHQSTFRLPVIDKKGTLSTNET